jgi:FeoB-associated Cys-rich membrane protein
MIQQILVGIIFLSALGFLASLLIRNLQAKEGCATGCGKCAADFKGIEGSAKNSSTPTP